MSPTEPTPITVSGLVLLIDDNRADNLFHELIFSEVAPAIDVVSLSSGRQALTFLDDLDTRNRAATDTLEPDWIFVDLNMPAMTGWEFIDAYEQRDRSAADAELVVLSTTENPEEVRRANRHPGVSRFLSKPLDPRKLGRLLNRAA